MKKEVQEKKRQELHDKYAKAVELYAQTDLPLHTIAKNCNVSAGGLGNYLRRYQRELVLMRHHMPIDPNGDIHNIKIIEPGKQNVLAHEKYKDAICACDSLENIEFNISQIARKFNLDGTALANFMKVHYPNIPLWREKVRIRLGINDNIPRGVRPECNEQYAEAVNLYQTSNMTLPEIAEICHISQHGFSQHLRFYHKDILKQKRKQREDTKKKEEKIVGEMSGNGRKYNPLPQTIEKYADALYLYQNTALTMKEIARKTEVSLSGFRFYLHKWHKNLVLERLGISGNADKNLDLRKAKRRMKSVAIKYEKAVESLRLNPRPIAKVAAEFGFHPDVFRDYLHKHEPELAEQQGMMLTVSGKKICRRSQEKYAEAISLYETTTESLKSIAKRLNLTYNSIGGYIRRNYPEIIQRHQNLLKDRG